MIEIVPKKSNANVFFLKSPCRRFPSGPLYFAPGGANMWQYGDGAMWQQKTATVATNMLIWQQKMPIWQYGNKKCQYGNVAKKNGN